MKKYVGVICILIMCFLMVGCENREEKKTSKYFVYYIGQDGFKLESVAYTPKASDEEEMIGEYLKQITSPEDEHYQSVVPDDLSINGYAFTDGIVTIDFDERYYDMSSQSEVLCRAAVVMTVSQVPKVEYVAFTVEGQPCMTTEGEMLGAMTASDFVADLGTNANEAATEDFRLYFANEDGTKLKEYVLKDARYGEKSKERFVLEQLIAGPKKAGYRATISPNVQLINVVTANNICYVDFEESFSTEISEVSAELTIYSIVNTLSELTDIHKVQISIQGDSSMKYHDEIPLADPLIRNLDLIEITNK